MDLILEDMQHIHVNLSMLFCNIQVYDVGMHSCRLTYFFHSKMQNTLSILRDDIKNWFVYILVEKLHIDINNLHVNIFLLYIIYNIFNISRIST
jgi:hypothetical protein